MPWQEASKVQTLLFDSDRFTQASAREWALNHGYKADKMDRTARYYRIRQRSPGEFRELRTITFGGGVKAVVGQPIKENRGEAPIAPSVREERLARDPVQRYTDAHWGYGPDRVYRVDDTDMPEELVMMGDLHAVQVENDKEHYEWKVPKRKTPDAVPSILGFTADNMERLYCVCNDEACAKNRHLLDADGTWYNLDEVARAAGGRQTRWAMPRVPVQVLGHCVAVVYYTNKKNDGWSEYIHKLGEETEIVPYAAVDEKGRLWLAGGDYTVPNEGIDN